MSPTYFNNVFKLIHFHSKSIAEFCYSGDKMSVNLLDGGDVHCRRKSIVRRLSFVHIVIRMDWFFTSHYSAGKFDCAVRNYFVHIHIGLRAASGLPNNKREVIVEFSINHFICGFNDEIGFIGRKNS